MQIIVIHRDITKHKKIEEALREGERKYRQLLEALQEGICAIDKDNIITYVNDPMANMLGYSVEEMRGHHKK